MALDSSAPEVAVSWRHAARLEDTELVAPERVVWATRRGSGFDVCRDPLSISLDLLEEVSLEGLLHPLLTVPVSVLARWRGDVTLHAGAFWTDAGAWAMIGEREAGKSTMLATLAETGCPIMGDDLLAILDGEVFAGPHCVDLRPDVAERFDSARSIGTVGGRQRFRLSTRPGPPRAPLRGVFVLAWHDGRGIAVEPLAAAERLELLYRQEYIALLGPAEPGKVLELMDLPAWRVSRPRDWEATDAAVEAILELAS